MIVAVQLERLGLHDTGKASRLPKTDPGVCVLWMRLLEQRR